MEIKNLFDKMGEMLQKPVEYIANTRILIKHIQEFNMSNGDVFRVTISKLKKKEGNVEK